MKASTQVCRALLVLIVLVVLPQDARAFCSGNVVNNGDFAYGLVYGSMPTASVGGWSVLTQTPQVVSTGCATPAGAMQMWGNLVVGESVKQRLATPIVQGKKYRVTVRYKHLNPGPSPQHQVAFRLALSASDPASYPPVAGYTQICVTPPTSSLTCVTYTVDWTATASGDYLTVNPENSSSINDGAQVSWGTIDDICISEVRCGFLANADFEDGVVYGSMPAASVANWSAISASPQVVNTGCATPAGAVQMWGNQVVGEAIKQQLSEGFKKGRTYRITVHYKHLNPGAAPQDQVRFRLTASSADPGSTYPPLSSNELIGFTQYTSSLTCVSDRILWTAENDAAYITINPENTSSINDGSQVSWGTVDDLCVEELPCGFVSNGDFEDNVVYGSMPTASVGSWSALTATPQVVNTGCATSGGAVQMWGNQVVGESIKQKLGAPFLQGRTYRIKVLYKHLNPGPAPTHQVRFRLTAHSGDPGSTYPPALSGGETIGFTQYTSSLTCVSDEILWSPTTANRDYLCINPENTSSINDGAEVSWGTIDDICVELVNGPDVRKAPGADPRAIALVSLAMALAGLGMLHRRRRSAVVARD